MFRLKKGHGEANRPLPRDERAEELRRDSVGDHTPRTGTEIKEGSSRAKNGRLRDSYAEQLSKIL